MKRRSLVSPWLVASLGFGTLVVACSDPNAQVPEQPDEAAPLSVESAALRIDQVSTATCSTEGAMGLSKQLVQQMVQCDAPGEFADLTDLDPKLKLGPRVAEIPYVYREVADRIQAAMKRRRDATLTINSAYRTLPQQYLLFKAHEDKRACQTREVATPGGSNHNAGLGVDIADHAGWQDALEKEKFTWYGENDDVHFDFRKDDKTFMKDTGAALKRLTILAFQRLWNRNHPEDPIGEDGDWGPQTRLRLEKSPAEGFPIGATCDADALLATTSPTQARVKLPSGRVASLAMASTVAAYVTVLDESTGEDLMSLDVIGHKEGTLAARGIGGRYLLAVKGPTAATKVQCRTQVVAGLFPRQTLLHCKVGSTTENFKLRVVERNGGSDEDLGAVVLDSAKGPVPFVPFTRADIKNPATGQPYEAGATVTIEEDGKVFWQGSVEALVDAMNEAEKHYAERGESLRGTGDLKLLELARSNVLLDAQRAETLGLRSEVLRDKIKEPLRHCPKLSLDDLGLPPEIPMSPINGGAFDPVAGLLGGRSAPLRTLSLQGLATSAVTPSQLVTLADGTRLEAGTLLDRLNQQQDALCSVGYDYVSSTPLGRADTLAALLGQRETILADLGVSRFSKHFNLATLAEVKGYADVLSEIDALIKNKGVPSAEQLEKWGRAAGLELPDDLEIPELPNIPSPVMPKRQDLKLLKRKTWDGLNIGDRKIASVYSNAWFEVRGQEKSAAGNGSELDARGEGKAGAFLFNNEINLVYGSGRFTAMPTQIDGALFFSVLGEVIIDKKLSGELAVAKSDRAWEYSDSLKYEESFMVGPIPVTVKAKLEGSMYLGYEFGLSFAQVYGRLIPGAAATLRVQGGVGVAGLSAGAVGEMTVIDASVPVTGSAALRFEDDLPFLQLLVTGDLEYRYLDGRMAAYAEWPWFSCSIRKGCRFTKKRAEREIFAWAGERGQRRILNWGMDLRPFGAAIKGDLIDQTDREELAALEAAASLEALKQETGRAEQEVFAKERATFRAVADDLSGPKATRVYEQIEAFKKAAASLDAETVELVRLASQGAGG